MPDGLNVKPPSRTPERSFTLTHFCQRVSDIPNNNNQTIFHSNVFDCVLASCYKCLFLPFGALICAPLEGGQFRFPAKISH